MTEHTQREKDDFIDATRKVQSWAYRIAKMKGFHLHDRSPLEAIALVHSELAELTEAFRRGEQNAPSEHIPDYTQAEEEIADAIIRLLDLAEEFSSPTPGSDNTQAWRIGEAIVSKIAYNAHREHKHGGKRY